MHTRIQKRKILFIFMIAAAAVFSASCRRSSPSDFRLSRLIDRLGRDGVRESPYLATGEAAGNHLLSPWKSFPLSERGVGDNPFNIKKKLNLGGAEINILFSPPKSVYAFDYESSGGSILEFGIGVLRDENSEKLRSSSPGEAEGVNFRVSLEINGREKALFEKYVPLPIVGEREFVVNTLELPPAKTGTHLLLETRGETAQFAFWYNPILYRKKEHTRPVILVSIDTLRADHLKCYGYGRDTSPAMDAFAEDGSLFLNTYSSSPWTLPAHVSMLTSLSNVRHQVYYDDEKMDPRIVTLAEVLRKEGFLTSAFTGGGFISHAYGFSKGFDSYREGEGGVFNQDSAEMVFRVVSEWIDRNAGKDFFLFIHTYQPHNPYACPYPYKTMFLAEDHVWRFLDLMDYLGGYSGIYKPLAANEKRNIIDLYDGEVRYTDEALVKPLLDKLKQMNLYRDALIVLTSDHGEEFFDHGSWTHGHHLYDESLKVPLLIKFPQANHKGKKVGNLVRLIDVMPTILDALDISPAGLDMEGRSLLPILRGKESGDRTFLADIGHNILNSHVGQKIAMNEGRSKIILNKPFLPEDLKYFSSPPPAAAPLELFDLVGDPGERSNIGEKNPALARRLSEAVAEVYKKAKKTRSVKTKVDETIKEQLRALGYIR